MRILLALVAFVGLAGPALGCINDRETPKAEREFRSDYGEPTPPPRPVPMAQSVNPKYIGAGAILLVGAFYVVSNRPRAKAEL